MNIVFLGPPACGKGTQAQLLTASYGFYQVSSGDLLRREMSNKGEQANVLKKIINSGQLVSSEFVVDLVEKEVAKNIGKSLLFDGFPRSVEQAIALDDILNKRQKKIDKAFYFEIGLEFLASRVQGRFACVGCGALYHEKNHPLKNDGVCDLCGGHEFVKRADDSVDVLKKRLEIFVKEAEPLKKYYQKKGILLELAAERSVLEVNDSIVMNINKS